MLNEKTQDISSKLKTGIPSIKDIEVTENLKSFSIMKEYSKKYLLNNKNNLKKYRWIRDSFNQWSRIYEYPFCLETIKQNIPANSKILDAGCGITFFPFFLNQNYTITCIDQDDYSDIFTNINKKQKTNVTFKKSTLQDIPLQNNTFDAIYCISVLEHTEDYHTILKEFHRLLKPQGIIIITFDIALDNNDLGIPEKTARILLKDIKKYFDLKYSSTKLSEELDTKNIYATKYVQKYKNNNLLPWPTFKLKRIIMTRIFKQKIPKSINLTFCNLVARKKII
ncbi:MAG: class I SAM-dependent methyltransferase [Candidatus Aenigmarchaeota archaeon]|nr:class I SAM-dependent methyltransferase [Candidatus Aenigmarchaeota archaeon]